MGKRRWGYALWLLAAAVLCFFENNTGTKLVMTASVMIPALSVVCAWRAARSVRAEIAAPEDAAEGENAQAECRLAGSRLLAGCCADYEVLLTNRMTGASCRHAAEDRGGRTIVPIGTDCCGAIEIGVPAIRVTDWFGLWAFFAPAARAVTCTVHPRLFAARVTVSPADQSREGAQEAVRRGLGAEETVGVRPYVPGDPIRMIHWKLSGKLDRPMVRETGVPQAAPLLLAMAPGRGEIPPADAHGCVKAMLSAATELTAQAIPCLAAVGVSEDTFRALPLDTAEDVRALEAALLDMPFGGAQEEIARLAERCLPDTEAMRTVLFATAAETDAASFYRGWPVTLVLPRAELVRPGSAEIAVRVLNERLPELEIG